MNLQPAAIIQTRRLHLRPWREKDFVSFAELNADPRVMQYFPSILNREESDSLAKRLKVFIEENGWGPWAVEVPHVADFIGFIGLFPVPFKAHFTPAIEIGWRIAYEFWGQGFAIEGARAALEFGFEKLHLEEIVSFTAVVNQRSQKLMKKLNMQHDPGDDFNHPRLPKGHPLEPHVLYRIKRCDFVSV